jgi:hypothetical protein
MSQTYLNIKVNAAGNLEISATPEGIEYLKEQVESEMPVMSDPETVTIEYRWKRVAMNTWWDLLESTATNGSYSIVPDNVFTLQTSAPCISKEMILPKENGEGYDYEDDNTIWVFRDYAIMDEFELLINGGMVIFTKVD